MTLYKTVLQSNFEQVDLKVREALDKLKEAFPNLDGTLLFKFNFMMRELLNNAVEHGNRMSFEKHVAFKIEYADPLIVFYFEDEGRGIDPAVISCEIIGDHDERNKEIEKAYYQIEDNATLETVKFAKAINLEDEIAVRHRGFETIKQLNFTLTIEDRKLKCTYDLSKEV